MVRRDGSPHRERSAAQIALIRFASTYLLVLVLPLVALVSYYLLGVRADLERRLETDVETRVAQVADGVEAELDQLRDIIYFIQVSSVFRFRSYDDPIRVVEVQARLAELATANRLIHTIAYYPYGAPRVYTSESPRYTELFRSESGILISEVQQVLETNKHPIMISTVGVRGPGVAVVSHIPVNSPYPEAVIAIELVTQALTEILETGLSAPTGVALELLFAGEAINEVGDVELLTSSGNDERVVRSAPIEPGGRVRVTASSSEVYADLRQSAVVLVAILLGVLAVCLPLIYAISLSGRSPIRELAMLLGPHKPASRGGSILSTATVELRRLQREVAAFEEASEDGIARERHEFLEQLLSGTIEDTTRLSARARRVGVRLQGRCFRVLVGDEHSEAGRQPYDQFCDTLQRTLGSDHVVYDVPNLQDARSTYLVISVGSASDHLFEQAFLETKRDGPLTVSCSREVARVEDVPRALIEAKSALEYRFVHGADRFLLARDVLEQATSAYGFPTDSIARLRAHAERLDLGSILDEVHLVIQDLRSQKPTLFVTRCVVYDMITAIVESLTDRWISADQYWRYLGAIDLADIKTLAKMEEVVAQLARDLIAVARELDADNGSVSTSFMQVVQHVERQVFNSMIGAKSMAAEFDMSVSNFSHQFKKCTGQTFSEFVLERRLRKAKDLLQNTDEPLSEIVRETGFGNVSSFIRRFRKVTGRTPIDYRRYARLQRSK